MAATRAIPKTNLCFCPSSTIVASDCAEKHCPRTPCRKIPGAAFPLIAVIIGERIELVRAFDVPLTWPAGEQSVRHHALIEPTRRGVAALAATLVCAVAWSTAAHDIPTDVKINAFVKPQGKRLELLIRVPLADMIEVDFPTRGP